MIGGDLIDFRLLFQDHILLVLLWVSVWGLFEMLLECCTGNSKLLRALVLILILIVSSLAICRLAKRGERLEAEELRQLHRPKRKMRQIT